MWRVLRKHFLRRALGCAGFTAIVVGVAVPAAAQPPIAPVSPAQPGSCLGPWLGDSQLDEILTGFTPPWKLVAQRLGQAVAIKDSHDPVTIAQYMAGLNLKSRGDFERALYAYSGLNAQDIGGFVAANAALVRSFSLAVQAHQDWYESLTARLLVGIGSNITVLGPVPEVQFSQDQLAAMRTAFAADDGLITNGGLLLAYPDREERNETVTRQYRDLSDTMRAITGADNALWSTYAVWASDEIGRNLFGNIDIVLAEAAGGNPRYWLSVGNSQLVSDIGPAFRSFVQTFGQGRNRGTSFAQFWAAFQQSHRGRNISYVDGSGDPSLYMENAFKAYYEVMQLNDAEPGIADPVQRAASSTRRAQLTLLANTLVGLQEQSIVQPVLDNGLCVLSVVNPAGAGGVGVDYDLPQADGSGDLKLHTDQTLPNTPFRVELSLPFTTVGGQTVPMNQVMQELLDGLRNNYFHIDRYNPANNAALDWQNYSQRMGFIFSMFADYQRYGAPIFLDPRQVFGTRSTPLDNTPEIAVLTILSL
ncbi:MAG: hypothetical protein P4L83_04925 [Nevskia sp.]|nr:hypothetical protein [Nevskia sp.]